MSHSRESSVSSLLSDDFSAKVKTNMMNKDVSTDYYVRSANKHLEEMAQRPNRKISLYGRDVDAHSILAAMLKYAPKDGRRYVACAIVSCEREVANQFDLANTWLCYLLLPIKGNSGRQRSRDPTDEATPSLEETQQVLNSIPKSQPNDFKTKLMHRDGFQCVVTGVYHSDCKPELQPRGRLEAAHIVRRSLAVFDERGRLTKVSSVTWEIIRQYTGWTIDDMTTMINFTDTPCNGFMLQKDFHTSFDMLEWTLAPIEDDAGLVIPNKYSVEVLERSKVPTLVPFHDIITFTDHSVTDEERMDEVYRTEYPKPCSVSLPHPELIAFHRAIANVLHMSGAAQAIDLAMDHIYPSGSPVKAMDAQELMLRLSSLQLMNCIHQDHSLL